MSPLLFGYLHAEREGYFERFIGGARLLNGMVMAIDKIKMKIAGSFTAPQFSMGRRHAPK